MTDVIRFAGAQIACTDDLETNISNIKKAIDWAQVKEVDYLLTPEGSLSGYIPDWDTYKGRSVQDVINAEASVVAYAKDAKVGLCLGTMWAEDDDRFPKGYRKENQIRFYSKTGNFLGSTNKHHTITSYDQTVPSEVTLIDMEDSRQNFWAAGLICNDFWGGPLRGQPSLPMFVTDNLNAQVIFHATNGFRGELPNYDDITDVWHEGNLRMLSYTCGIPIITVDNNCKMNGLPYEGKTSSASGILLNGVWQVKVPRTGTQYFYYDFSHSDIINFATRKHPDQDILDQRPDITGEM